MRDQPPNDIDAESATIGSMLADNSIIADILCEVSEADFYNRQAARMFREIVSMYESGTPADAVTLGTRLGDKYVHSIGKCLEKNQRTMHGPQYARTVRDMAERRKVIEESKERIAKAFDVSKALDVGGNANQADSPPVEPYQPFPVDTLPEPARGFVQAGAKAIGCDPSFLALPLLTMFGAAIGNTRKIVLKKGWAAPPILWTAIVGESGTQKSVGWKTAKRAIVKRQAQALKEHAAELDRHQQALADYEKRLAQWKHDKKTLERPPTKPKAPTAVRHIVEDVTVEGLAPLLLANPRGLALARDELAGWIGSFNQYKQGKGADSAHWLSMYNGESMLVDRKTGNPPTIFVPSAAVAVTGGIQPGTLNRALGAEHRESGLAARILLACPPRIPKQWTEAIIDPNTEAAVGRVFNRIYDEVQFGVNAEGDSCPIFVSLNTKAKTEWVDFYTSHNRELVDLSGDLAAAWSKLEEIPARLALIFHFVRWAADDPALESSERVDVDSMVPAIALTQWFKQETRRVYGILAQSEEAQERNRLADWIRRKGGRVTVRQVQQGHRRFKTAEDAESALHDLVKARFGKWVEVSASPKGGPASRGFKLFAASTVYTTPTNSGENGGSVDVDSVDDAESEWGEI